VPRKKKPKEEPLKFPGPEGDLYEGDRRLRAYTIDWNDPDWEKIET
jgi:hypothetical protein